MDKISSILVAVDFSPSSADALRQALRIASWGRAAVMVQHVLAMPTVAIASDAMVPFDLPVAGVLLDEAHQRWTRFAEEVKAPKGTPVDITLGSPRLTILERVKRDRPDLLVMGAHGLIESEVGPTAAACVQRAATKVLLVRRGQTGPFRSIVACIDFTETSHVALEQAVRVAAQDGAVLHILHVYEDPWYGLGPTKDVRANMPDFSLKYRHAVEERLRSYCKPLQHEVNALKAHVHARQSEDHGKGIVDFVTHGKCDLAVLGTRAKWNARGFFLGSTAERVMRSAPCSILAIKPPGFDQTV